MKSNLKIAIFFYILFLIRNGHGNLGSECWYDSMCNSWLFQCQNYQCVCRNNYIPSVDNTKCVIGINEVCLTYSDECYDPNAECDRPGGTIWDQFYCYCKEGFTQNPETQLCSPKLREKCETDGTPCIAGSCVDNICQCDPGSYPNEDRDRCGVPVGGSCNDQNLCSDPDAICNDTNYICECREEYQAVDDEYNVKVCRKALGAFCVSANDCAATNATCETMLSGNGACTCIQGYVPSNDRTSCLQVANHWPGTCQENIQCIAMFGRYSVCQSNSCICQIGYIYSAIDFGCIPQHGTDVIKAYEGIKLLTKTMLSYLPIEAKTILEDVLLNEI